MLSKADVADFRHVMDASDWEDGRSTAGAQSALVKRNEQLPPDSDVARKLGNRIVSALTANPRFLSAAIPLHIFPPLFNRYAATDGHHFGIHVDNAVRGDRLTGLRIRTDLSVTLFLSEPEEYDGGELVIEDTYGSHEVKLPAGDLVLYPASSLHLVTPVTRGRAGRVLLLAAEHDPRYPGAQPDLRSRQFDPVAGRAARTRRSGDGRS